ncbi:MAG: SH3 domain-containing protein [Chloroflexota bacterium]
MKVLTSSLLAAFVLMLPLSAIAAPTYQATVDVKSIAIVKADLPSGFEIVPDRTVSEDRDSGVAVYDVTFSRERTAANLAAGPFEVRSGVARTAQTDDATLQFDSTKEAFVGEGWTETGVPQLGDEAVGLTQTTDGEGGKISHFSYLFRKNTYIMMIGVRGRPEATKMNDAVSLAIVVSGRLDKALSGGSTGSTGSTTAPSGPTSSSGATTPRATGEKVKVVNADGGSVNMRAEPSTGAAVVTQVAEGTVLDVVGPNKDGDGRTWRNVRTADNQTGWIASTFLETVTPAPPTPAASPAPAAPRAATPVPTETTTDPSATPDASPSPSPSASPAPDASSNNTFRGSGNGLVIEGQIRDLNLSSGKQLVKVRVTRNGGPVQGAFVDITARLDAKRYRSIKADTTNDSGWTEAEWDMEGPAGTYEVQVDVKTAVDGPVTTAKSSFKWKS